MRTDITTWKYQIRAGLADLERTSHQRLGYPIDGAGNFIIDTAGKDLETLGHPLPASLEEFYRPVWEVSLPDVHIGYFVHPPDRLVPGSAWDYPERIEVSSLDGPIVMFGSDGGGGLFALLLQAGSVLHLPPGEIRGRVYEGGLEQPHQVSPDFDTYLELLLKVLKEFVTSGTTTGL